MFGPSGSGKSALASALAGELGLELVEILPPSKDGMDKWERSLAASMSGSSLFGSSMLLLFNDVDKWNLSSMRGATQKLIPYLKNCPVPVIFTAQDAYDKSLSSFRAYCQLLELKAINNSDICSCLKKIAAAQNLGASADMLKKISINSKGDLRAAINDLQAGNSGAERESEKKHFEIVRSCFRSPSYASTKSLSTGPLLERGTLKLYVSENLPAEFADVHDLAAGFERLSRADVFDGRISRTQYWGYLRYSSSLLSWGVSSERRHVRAGFAPYSFPSYIRKMGASKSRRAARKLAAQKIAPLLHTTTRNAILYIPLINAQASALKKKGSTAGALCAFYKFDEEEAALVLNISPLSAKAATG